MVQGSELQAVLLNPLFRMSSWNAMLAEGWFGRTDHEEFRVQGFESHTRVRQSRLHDN